jgi:Na+-driven multidrug efflux pump
MQSNEIAAGDFSRHRRILGVCWVVYGIFRLIMGICLILFHGTATVMFGALLNRVSNPFALMDDFHVVYIGIVVLTVLCGLLGLLAGLALLGNQRTARTLALLVAFLSVSEIPFGTTLGIYTLIVLFPLRSGSPQIRS